LMQLMCQNLFKSNSLTFPKYFTRRKLVTEPYVWSVRGATTNSTVGTTWNSVDNSQAKEKTQSSSGTPTSQTSGVMLTIRYQWADGEANAKIFKVNEDEAYDFLTELNEGAPFPALISKEQTVVFPADKIYEIRIEKENVSEVSKSKREKAAKLDGGKTT